MTWVNADGLTVRFGNEQAAVAKTGVVDTAGELQQLVVLINGVDVPSTDAPISIYTGFPQNAVIVNAELYVTTAFAGTNATLDIGVWSDDGDGTYTVVDKDGLFAQVATTALDTLNGADDYQVGAGALVGTRPAAVAGGRDFLISASYNTAAFTAGVATMVLTYRKTA